MWIRKTGFALLMVALSAAGGCRGEMPSKTAAERLDSKVSAQCPENIAQIHWLGKKRLATETNAAAFLRIWNEPESAKLEARFLDRLSTAPWRLNKPAAVRTTGGAPNTGQIAAPLGTSAALQLAPADQAAAAALRSLFADAVQEETYFDIRQTATNRPLEWAVAIRLAAPRAGLWQTNVAALLQSLYQAQTVSAPSGSQRWLLKSVFKSNNWIMSAELVRAGEWTLLSFSDPTNNLLAPLQKRIQAGQASSRNSGTNFWLSADVELSRVGSLLMPGCNLLENLSQMSFWVYGDGQEVRTRAQIELAKPMSQTLEPWQIPTNLIRSPLISLTAAREVRPLLGNLKFFSDFPGEPPPNQICWWTWTGLPLPMFCAVPVKNAATAFDAVAPIMLTNINQGLTPKYGSVSLDTAAHRLDWNGLPIAMPFLQAVTNLETQFLFGGFGAPAPRNARPIPPELLAHILEGTNLLYFDWEITGRNIAAWRYLDDGARIAFDAAHMPRLKSDTAGVNWVGGNMTNLFDEVTEVRLTQPNQWTLTRKSTVGLTAPELELLLNWVELSEFPRGLHTLLEINTTSPMLHRRGPRPAISPQLK